MDDPGSPINLTRLAAGFAVSKAEKAEEGTEDPFLYMYESYLLVCLELYWRVPNLKMLKSRNIINISIFAEN